MGSFQKEQGFSWEISGKVMNSNPCLKPIELYLSTYYTYLLYVLEIAY